MDRLKKHIEQKAHTQNGRFLPLMEAFYTIQGEGYNTGKAAFFIRIGGCDVGCHWCDVKESWDAAIYPLTSSHEIVARARKYTAKAVVITGGEPSMYPLDYLTDQLRSEKIKTFVETSGAYPLSGYWDWVCLSPKKSLPPLHENYHLAHELKVIVYNKHDFIWANENALKVSPNCCLYLQPEWSKSKEITPLIIDYVKENPQWNISLQTHKFLNIP